MVRVVLVTLATRTVNVYRLARHAHVLRSEWVAELGTTDAVAQCLAVLVLRTRTVQTDNAWLLASQEHAHPRE